VAGDIATYNRKRNFRRTAEPPGEVSRTSQGLPRFVIQKHDASRLHYDFRLEIDGVLASWAVPKGPSLDPGEKRLAVRTEDHPVAYGSFEGRIPEDEYGGGTVMLWDRGTYRPIGNARDGLRKGDLKFELNGSRLQGSFVLARMRGRREKNGRAKKDGENWLLIKHRDAAARPGSGDAVVREFTDSVDSDRSLQQIASGDAVWHSNRAAKRSTGRTTGRLKEEKTVARRKTKIARIDVAGLKGARKARMPAKIAPQLATLVEAAPAGKGWISEIKFDGYRMLARIDDGDVKIFSRNGLPWAKKLPAIARSLGRLKAKQAWLDGEIVVLDAEGKSDFGRLKDALGGESPGDVFFFLFDILYLDGYNTMACRQDDRKRLLESVLGGDPPPFLKYSGHMAELPERIQRQACRMHLEGIIVKAADAPYQQRRSRNWLKLKCIQREEFVVIGYTDPQGTRAGFGALHLGYYDRDGDLHYAGGMGAGFNTKTLLAIEKTLARHVRKIPPAIWIHGEKPPAKMHWVRPEMVVETQYIDWTGAGALRHAVFLGIREDKAAADVVRDPPTDAVSRYSGTGTIVTAARAKPKPKAKQGRKPPPGRADVPAIIDNRQPDDGAVRLTHPNRLLWPEENLSKQDLAAYWERAADHALPYIGGRPLALVRTPDGIAGETFFQKKASPGFPRQILDLELEDEAVIAIDSREGFRALAQMSAVEIHPWGSTIEDISKPNLIVMDLDPDAGLDFEDVIHAAHDLRDALKAVGLHSFCKTTGGKGLHVVVPFRPQLGWDQIKAFAKSVATAFARSDPKRFTDALPKRARKGRIFIDYLRNGRGATAVAPFSPRARPGATIAMPLGWSQVKPGLDPADYTIRASDRMLRAGAAAWRDFFATDQRITDKIRRAFTSI
jgi:bifunctional non-homologous end joining protein LigD